MLRPMSTTTDAGPAAGVRWDLSHLYAEPDDPMVNWEADDLVAAFETASFETVRVHAERRTTEVQISQALLARWFPEDDVATAEEQRRSYAQRLLTHLTGEEVKEVQALLERQLRGQVVAWSSSVAYLLARWP